MLSFEEFKLKYPDEFALQLSGCTFFLGIKVLAEGYLKFTKETASSWAGPFKDDYAYFIIRDYSQAVYNSGRDKGKKFLDVLADGEKKFKAKLKRGSLEYRNILPIHINDRPSLTSPISFAIYGNDDTSHTKFYHTANEALEDLELFIANEPLDYKIVYDFNFIFTN